jgi:hypothetical protein
MKLRKTISFGNAANEIKKHVASGGKLHVASHHPFLNTAP